MTKIVLKAQTADLDRGLREVPGCVEVRDLGHTELAPDTRTVVVLPVLRSRTDLFAACLVASIVRQAVQVTAQTLLEVLSTLVHLAR